MNQLIAPNSIEIPSLEGTDLYALAAQRSIENGYEYFPPSHFIGELLDTLNSADMDPADAVNHGLEFKEIYEDALEWSKKDPEKAKEVHENYLNSMTEKAIVNIPDGVNGTQSDGSVILDEMIEMNGQEITVVSENWYRGEVGIDWEKYDYAMPIDEGGDAYCWKKEWLIFEEK